MSTKVYSDFWFDYYSYPYHVKSGLFKVVRLQEDGTPFLFNIIVPRETIPHHSLISPKEYYGTAIALTKTEVEVIPPSEWYGRLNTEPEAFAEVALQPQTKLRMMQQRMDQLYIACPKERLNYVQEWFNSYASDMSIHDMLTQTEIAQLVGLRRETVNRILQGLKKP
jgi:CRP-like cAMP-binding protein